MTSLPSSLGVTARVWLRQVRLPSILDNPSRPPTPEERVDQRISSGRGNTRMWPAIQWARARRSSMGCPPPTCLPRCTPSVRRAPSRLTPPLSAHAASGAVAVAAWWQQRLPLRRHPASSPRHLLPTTMTGMHALRVPISNRRPPDVRAQQEQRSIYMG